MTVHRLVRCEQRANLAPDTAAQGGEHGATLWPMPTPDAVAEFDFDGTAVAFTEADTVLSALVRDGRHPTGGGCLCAGGDCPHCVVSVDGIAYVRSCLTTPRAGMYVEAHPAGGDPQLPSGRFDRAPPGVRRVHVDVVVVGGGTSGRAAAAAVRADGRSCLMLDAADGEEVVGVYAGPFVVARGVGEMIHAYCSEVVVATGAAEVQPVCPGNDLQGIYTLRAAETMAAAGVDLGTVVAIGGAPQGLDAAIVGGDLVRFEGTGTVTAVVARNADGVEVTHPCDSAVVALGLIPRDTLARMARGLPVRVVGEAAAAGALPRCPDEGVVCPCVGVTVDQLDSVWDRGFREIELIKRATLAGTGTCQGGACMPHLRAFIADRGDEVQPAFTARPVSRQLTFGEVAASEYHPAHPRTALDAEHRRLGARMDRIGGWWRPWTYGDPSREYHAVRTGVSVGDVGTLGKMIVSGPDADEALQWLYPTDVSTIRPGRSRYALMLNERGYVLDDGMVCRESSGDRFYLTFTSGGASMAEMWVRDWTAEFDVRLANVTASAGAINVTGPRSRELLERAGFDRPLSFLEHTETVVAGVPCKVFRLSFTGELSYELHHPQARSVDLWRRLFELGADLGVAPHGLEALLQLRLEKGHIIVGQDTDYDSTPRRLDHGWAVRMDKGDFVGRQALTRTDRIPLDKMLVGLELDGDPVAEGAVIWHRAEYAGYVTSSARSPARGKSVMLAWVSTFDGVLPDSVVVDGREAARAAVPFYDPEGTRARA